MKNIFVVTHTQSVHHVENKVGGWYDTELTPKGKADAQATAEKLVALIGNASVEIFSSDLLRASQTAAIIAEHLKSPFETTDGLRESATVRRVVCRRNGSTLVRYRPPSRPDGSSWRNC